jgi:IS5 family transposase
MPGMPCNATELVHFRKRIGVEGFNLIFKMSVAAHSQALYTRYYVQEDFVLF